MKTIHTPLYIVEGNIGAGKSTFLKTMQSRLDAHIVLEPHTQWQDVGGSNLLDLFYHDTQRWAYTMQTYAFVSRVLNQNTQSTDKPYVLSERSVYADRYCFAKNCYELGYMNQLEWDLYKTWFNWLVKQFTQKPSGFIYLRTDPETCFTRLKKRARSEEDTVTLDYLQTISQKHDQWLIDKKDVEADIADTPVLVLDVTEEFKDNDAIIEHYSTKLENFFEKTVHCNQQPHRSELWIR